MATPKKKRTKQGHPAKLVATPITPDSELDARITRLATQSVYIVRDIINSGRFSADEILTSKASSIGYLHLLAKIEGKPSPYEIHSYDHNLNAALVEEINEVRERQETIQTQLASVVRMLERREQSWGDLQVPDLRSLSDEIKRNINIIIGEPNA